LGYPNGRPGYGIDHSDARIGRINHSLSAEHTVTFDRDLKAVETFRLL